MSEKITVIGAGTMGHGIAHVAAQSGYQVVLYDSKTDAATQGIARVRTNLDEGIKRGKLTEEIRDQTLSRLSSANDLASAVDSSSLVIEAIVEDLAIKQDLFAQLEKNTTPSTILASNTSSIPLTQIAAKLTHPERVIGLHFFNPVHIMQLVEIVVHKKTSEQTKETSIDVVKKLSKEPIVVQDFPGFASSRLGIVLGLEAMRMVEQGVASPEDIDKAMELGYRHPMGPLKLTDLVGLDVRLSIAEILHRELKGEQYRPPEILRQKVKAGELGKKSGKGFYQW